MNKNDCVVFDSMSARHIDDNGFMHVNACHITKEQVVPYYGREIPGWRELGLEAENMYKVYRPAAELEKAVSTFNGLPLLLEHYPESAENPQKLHRVGSLGTDAVWNAPYLDISLHVTDQAAIDAIEQGRFKELSAAYQYEPVMQPGEFNGQKYDIIMRNIHGNHVALVREGRAGPDVVVADSKPAKKRLSFKQWYTGKLAQDAAQRGNIADWLKIRGLNLDKMAENKPQTSTARFQTWYNKVIGDAMPADGAPLGNNNAAKNHVKKQANEKKIRTADELSPTGVNKFTVRGFPSKQKRNNHWQNGGHQEEYPEYESAEQYEAAALKLLESSCGGDISGHLDKNGNVIRYNKNTNDFVKGHPDKGVTTMFRPVDGSLYYEQQKELDVSHGGRS